LSLSYTPLNPLSRGDFLCLKIKEPAQTHPVTSPQFLIPVPSRHALLSRTSSLAPQSFNHPIIQSSNHSTLLSLSYTPLNPLSRGDFLCLKIKEPAQTHPVTSPQFLIPVPSCHALLSRTSSLATRTSLLVPRY
jgi:hypothetical protein